jgi:hypothetical protein
MHGTTIKIIKKMISIDEESLKPKLYAAVLIQVEALRTNMRSEEV